MKKIMVHDNDRSKVTGSKPRGGRAGMLAALLALAGISAFAAEKNAADAMVLPLVPVMAMTLGA